MTSQETQRAHLRRKLLIGVVTSAKMNKTRRVEVTRTTRHRQYGKYLRHRTVCYAHDEANASQEGDRVEIMETRPLSKLKRWRLVRVVAVAPALSAAAETPIAESPAG